LPTAETTLSLAWMNGQVRALAVHKGVIEGSWQCPSEVDDVASFATLLRDAVTNTGYRGSTVSVVLAHPRLGLQLLEAPPTNTTGVVRFLERQLKMVLYLGVPPDGQPALARYVQRQVQNLKTFDGEAAWCFEPTLPNRGRSGLLLHLFPKNLLNLLIQGCAKADLYLAGVTPATAVLRSQLPHLPIEKDEVALLVGDLVGSSAVVVGRADGQLLLGRTLAGSWNQNASRFLVDLQRTILFVNQEFGVNIGSLWLFGSGASEHLAEVQTEIGLPVQVSPVEYHELYWTRDSLLLPVETTPNLLSREDQQTPPHRLWAKLAACGTLLLVLGSLATSVYLSILVWEERGNCERLQPRVAELQARHKELQSLGQQLLAKQALVKLVSDDRLPAVAGWFLGYLGEAVPPELLLTNAHIRRQNDLWQVRLAGVPQPTTNQAPGLALSNAVALLERRLTSGPFGFKSTNTTDFRPPAMPGPGGPSLSNWVARLSAATSGRGAAATQFAIEGVMR
jgi:hypothetical protein